MLYIFLIPLTLSHHQNTSTNSSHTYSFFLSLKSITPLMADHNPPRRQPIFLSWKNPVVPGNQKLQLAAAITLLSFTQDPFKLKKVLTKSDVDGSSRFLLKRDLIEEHILPFMDPHDAQLCRTISGKEFPVFDMNDDSLQHLVLKKWKNSYFVFTKNWVPDFVTRKNLEAGDQVGVAFFNGQIFFKLLKKKEN